MYIGHLSEQAAEMFLCPWYILPVQFVLTKFSNILFVSVEVLDLSLNLSAVLSWTLMLSTKRLIDYFINDVYFFIMYFILSVYTTVKKITAKSINVVLI